MRDRMSMRSGLILSILSLVHVSIQEVMEHKKFIYRCRVCGDTSRRHNRRPPQPADCRGMSTVMNELASVFSYSKMIPVLQSSLGDHVAYVQLRLFLNYGIIWLVRLKRSSQPLLSIVNELTHTTPTHAAEYRLAPGKTAGPDLDCHDPACRYHAHQRTCAAGKDGYDLIAQPERQGNGKGAGAGAGGTPKKRKGAGPAPGSPGKGQRTLADFVTAGGGGAGRADEGGAGACRTFLLLILYCFSSSSSLGNVRFRSTARHFPWPWFPAGPPPARPPIDGDGAEHCEADAPFENMRRHAGGTRLLPPPDLDPDEDGAAPRRPPRKRPRPAPPPPPPTVPSATERAVLVAGPGLGPAWPGAPRTLAPSTEHDPSQDIDTRTVVIDPSPAPLDPREAAARAAMRRFGAPRVPMGGGVKGGALRGAEVEAAGGARGPMFGRLPLGRMFTAGPGASSAPTVGLAATAAAARIGAEKGGHGHEIEAQPAESEEIVVIIDDD